MAGWAAGRLAAQQAAAAGACPTDLVAVNTDRRVIAIDGKTLPGSAPPSTPAQVDAARSGAGRTHLVAACHHASGVTSGQVGCSREAGKGR